MHLNSIHPRLPLVGLLVLASQLMVACGGSSGETPDPTTDPSVVGSEAPSADDQPITEDPAFNNAVGFSVVREPGARLAVVEVDPEISDATFELGLPEAVITVPEGVDTTTNQAPFFEDLQNLTVEAGEIIEIVYRPQDPEGELPGMFPEKLPQGGTFDDNFDGSKTFRWQPLQMDVGILKFTVTALDPENSLYRTSQPILIKTVLPEDLSSIPNVAPTLDTLLTYTARVNDPVVFELKGIDLNGTVPTLEVPNLPAGATFNQHPRFEEVFVLKFTPTTVGETVIDVLARDSVDSSLTTTEAVSLSVLAADAFDRDGSALKALASNRNVQIGFAALQSFYHQPDGAIYASTAAQEYDIVTPENSMKMDYLNPEPGRYQFAATDNLVAFANANAMAVHGHPLVWYRQLPTWITSSVVAERETHMSEYIERVMTRYADDVSVWDVINEPMADDGSLRDSVWLEAMGSEYIDKALTQARTLAPAAAILINEFDIGFAGPKFDGLVELVDGLQERDVPLDGIGFQMHVFTSFNQFDELEANFAQIAARDLDIYITELDVSLDGSATIVEQAAAYQQVVNICLEQVRCKAIQTWGLTDQYSFRSNFDPLLFDRAYQAKPAYGAVQDALSVN